MTNQEFFATLTNKQRKEVLAERKSILKALQGANYTIGVQQIEQAFNEALMLFGWA